MVRRPHAHLVVEDTQRDGRPRQASGQPRPVLEPLRRPRRVHERRKFLPADLRQAAGVVDRHKVPRHLLHRSKGDISTFLLLLSRHDGGRPRA